VIKESDDDVVTQLEHDVSSASVVLKAPHAA
jgi:hypothetical protein